MQENGSYLGLAGPGAPEPGSSSHDSLNAVQRPPLMLPLVAPRSPGLGGQAEQFAPGHAVWGKCGVRYRATSS